VEVSLNTKSRFNEEFLEESVVDGLPIMITEKAKKLLNRDNIVIDEGGWILYKHLIIQNAPIVRASRSSKGICSL